MLYYKAHILHLVHTSHTCTCSKYRKTLFALFYMGQKKVNVCRPTDRMILYRYVCVWLTEAITSSTRTVVTTAEATTDTGQMPQKIFTCGKSKMWKFLGSGHVQLLTGRSERQRFTSWSGILTSIGSRWHSAISSRPMPEHTDFAVLQLDWLTRAYSQLHRPGPLPALFSHSENH